MFSDIATVGKILVPKRYTIKKMVEEIQVDLLLEEELLQEEKVVHQKNLNALMANSVFLCHSFAMGLKKMEMLGGLLIARMVLMKILKCVARKDCMKNSIALI